MKLRKNQRYILTFADGSMTDPLLPSEMSKQDHEEAVSIEPYNDSDGLDRNYQVQYAHACGYRD